MRAPLQPSGCPKAMAPPLTAIAREAELGQLTGDPAMVDLQAMRTQATAELWAGATTGE